MYGIVNKAIEDLVREKFGNEIWEQVKVTSGVDIDFFISNEPYDDQITYQLAVGCSKTTGLDLATILHQLGEWWVIRTSKEKYGSLLQAGGASLRQFLLHLPIFHNRVMLLFPKLSPPEFKVNEIAETCFHVSYYSKRQGLQSFVEGLLSGISQLYGIESTIELIQKRDEGCDYDVFRISW